MERLIAAVTFDQDFASLLTLVAASAPHSIFIEVKVSDGFA